MTDKQIYQIGLTMINGVGDILARHLLEALEAEGWTVIRFWERQIHKELDKCVDEVMKIIIIKNNKLI